MSSTLYDDAFFARHIEATLRSARIIVPHVLQQIHPKSVIDVGCARGVWLRAFSDHGVSVLQGVDGHYVDPSTLLIDAADFTPVDLIEMIAGDCGPFLEKANGRYDLALCLEVAEHLPHASADNLVRTLTTLAPVVLFSAAVPGQGGIGHINEQWPGYWRLQFRKYGFQRIDSIRRRIWKDRRLHWWYRQNLFLFASQETIAELNLVRVEEKLARHALLEAGSLEGDEMKVRWAALLASAASDPAKVPPAFPRILAECPRGNHNPGMLTTRVDQQVGWVIGGQEIREAHRF